MDTALKDLGVTFLVGAFAILGFEFVLHYLLDKDLTGFFRGELGLTQASEGAKAAQEARSNIRTTVFVALAFAVGIVAEDASYKFMDSGWLPLQTNSKASMRAAVLMRKCDHDSLVPSRLGFELAQAHAFTRFTWAGAEAEPLEAWLSTCSTDAKPECHRIPTNISAIDGLYYFAKNTVYRNDNYYDEMRRIQTRSEFSRSVLILASFYAALAIAIIVLLKVLPSRQPGFQARGTSLRREGLRVLTLLLFLAAISYWAFYRESLEFNKRAFGYFSSQLLAQADSARAY
jgi:hypothetical protein